MKICLNICLQVIETLSYEIKVEPNVICKNVGMVSMTQLDRIATHVSMASVLKSAHAVPSFGDSHAIDKKKLSDKACCGIKGTLGTI